jgi:hypothetical protein
VFAQFLKTEHFMGIDGQQLVLRDGYKRLRFCCSLYALRVGLLPICNQLLMGETVCGVWIAGA